MNDITLLKIGKLYDDDLLNLTGANFTTQLIVSFLTSLSETNFAKSRNGEISLSTDQMSLYLNGFFSSRMIRRQLNIIENLYPSYYQEKRFYEQCKICFHPPRKRKNFTLIFLIPELQNNFTASMTVFFSLLLDKAAFNFRSGLGFKVIPSQMTNICDEMGVTKKTLTNHLKKLQDLNLIFGLTGEVFKSGLKLFQTGFNFDDRVLMAYQNQVNLKPSALCKKLVSKQTFKVNRGRIVRSNEYEKHLKAQRAESENIKKARQAQGISHENPKAYEPQYRAVEPKYEAQKVQFTSSLDEAILEVKKIMSKDLSTENSVVQNDFNGRGESNMRFKNTWSRGSFLSTSSRENFGHRPGKFWSPGF